MKNRTKIIFLSLIIVTFLTSLFGCDKKKEKQTDTDKSENIEYICEESSFFKALQGGKSAIYLGDISFATQMEIIVNYPVEFIGKPEKSTIENAYFKINGTNVPNDSTTVSFKNLVLDGKTDKSAIPFEEGKTFGEIVGTMPQHHAIDGSIGYINLSIDNCEIKNYLHEDGPAIYIDNNVSYREREKTLTLTNSVFHNNICYAGTVKVFSDVLTTTIDHCDFYDNTARAGQGISVGNGHSYIYNTSIHDNDFFHFVYRMERTYPTIFHNDKKTFKGLTTNAVGGYCGALFIGGSHTTVDNCKIYNNTTVYGGGIGIFNASTLEQDEKVEIKNTEIINNTALLCGGGIYLESNQGETTYFTNCNIIGNNAGEDGSAIYTTTYLPDKDTAYGGNVLFSFCTIVGNTATDADTFTFYELLNPKLAGNISLKGCFVLDNSPYTSEEKEYNYLSTKEQALNDFVIVSETDTNPLPGSIGDIEVPSSDYKTWTNDFSDATQGRKIGYIPIVKDTFVGKTEKGFPYWTLVFPAVFIIGIAVFFLIYLQNKKNKQQEALYAQIGASKSQEELLTLPPIDYSQYTFSDIASEVQKLYGHLLTKREITITTYLLYGKTRKEIAQELFVSEDTIKTHLSHIFKKIKVSSKVELKQIVETKLFADSNQ